MEEPARLVCPECNLVYKVKRIVPGKQYECRNCGAGLNAAPDDAEVDKTIVPPPSTPERSRAGRRAAAAPLASTAAIDARIQKLVTAAEALLNTAQQIQPVDLSDQLQRLEQSCRNLEALVSRFESDGGSGESGEDSAPAVAGGDGETLAQSLVNLQQQITDISAAIRPESMENLAFLVRETAETLNQRLASQQDELAAKLAETLRASMPEQPLPADASATAAPAPELDIDYLANRIAAEISKHAPAAADPNNPAMVDALASVAEQLVHGQNANKIKLDNLSEEIHSAVRVLAELDNWHGRLPDKVADEIGRTVQDRVVEPISSALAKQAPAILSELQDNKLVDIVSRSVREAQRPLLREILARNKGGIPAWLFAAVLLPLLLILGYLFLPGTFGDSGEERARLDAELSAIADTVHRVEAGGVPLRADVEDRLLNIEEVVMDIHGEALAHAKNAAALEEEARGLRETLGERDRLIKEYTDLLQRQVRRIRAYETRLTRLGVSPDTVEE